MESKEGVVTAKKLPGYDHFFLQEMNDQPEAVAKSLNYLGRL